MYGNGDEFIESVASASDGGIIVGGYFESPYSSYKIQLGNEILINTTGGYKDGLLIKYNAEGEVEWAKSIGGWNNDIDINSVSSTRDGGFIVGGYFNSRTIQVGKETLLNNSDKKNSYLNYSDE